MNCTTEIFSHHATTPTPAASQPAARGKELDIGKYKVEIESWKTRQ